MIKKVSSNVARKKRHARVRKTIVGTPELPRLNVYRSNSHIYAQIIDDANHKTLVSASTKAEKMKNGGNVEAAKQIGKLIAEKATKEGINNVVFDRGGYLYHGRVQALAESAREAGLKF